MPCHSCCNVNVKNKHRGTPSIAKVRLSDGTGLSYCTGKRQMGQAEGWRNGFANNLFKFTRSSSRVSKPFFSHRYVIWLPSLKSQIRHCLHSFGVKNPRGISNQSFYSNWSRPSQAHWTSQCTLLWAKQKVWNADERVDDIFYYALRITFFFLSFFLSLFFHWAIEVPRLPVNLPLLGRAP